MRGVSGGEVVEHKYSLLSCYFFRTLGLVDRECSLLQAKNTYFCSLEDLQCTPFLAAAGVFGWGILVCCERYWLMGAGGWWQEERRQAWAKSRQKKLNSKAIHPPYDGHPVASKDVARAPTTTCLPTH